MTANEKLAAAKPNVEQALYEFSLWATSNGVLNVREMIMAVEALRYLDLDPVDEEAE